MLVSLILWHNFGEIHGLNSELIQYFITMKKVVMNSSNVVYGSTEGIADKLSKHGRFTRNMRIDENTKVDGYWFSNKRLSEVIEIINNAS